MNTCGDCYETCCAGLCCPHECLCDCEASACDVQGGSDLGYCKCTRLAGHSPAKHCCAHGWWW